MSPYRGKWWPEMMSPSVEPELRGDGSDTDLQPGRERLFDLGGSDDTSHCIDSPPAIDTARTAPASRAHDYTIGLGAPPCTITLEEWRRRNGA